MENNVPYARRSDVRLEWDIYIDAGDLAVCLTEHLTSAKTEEEAWQAWSDEQDRDAMNIRNYGFI